MATKAELEQEVEQLKAQLASATPPDVAALTAELDQLKADLDSACDERDAAAAQLADESQKSADLQAQLDSVKSDLKVAQDALAAKAAKPSGAVGPDRVVLDGKEHPILWRSTVKDLVWEGFKKGHLDENHTGLVIPKIGG
jgi:chromosome segregation ATPase